MAKRRGLGRGLDALLTSKPAAEETAATPEAAPAAPAAKPAVAGDGDLRELPLDVVQRGQYQPRRDMNPEALNELADSIKAQGLMQPIVVRPISGGRYEIIAGERRWRASQIAGLDTIPVLIRHVADEAAGAMALIENIQREDLNPMEEALALQRLQQEFELTHQQMAEQLGKSRSAITNLLRLTNLREDVQRLLERGDLEMGHARALLALPETEQAAAAAKIVDGGLSVRQAEALVKQLQAPPAAKLKTAKIDPDLRRLQEDLSERVGTAVSIKHKTGKGSGELVLKYSSLEQLDGLLSRIK